MRTLENLKAVHIAVGKKGELHVYGFGTILFEIFLPNLEDLPYIT